MLQSRKPGLGTEGVSTRFCIALLFVVAASLSALAHADTRSVEGFDIDTVILRGSDELKIEWSDANRLLVKGDERDLDKQPFYVRGNTLYLGYTEERRRVRGVKYLLEVDSLEEIQLEGSGKIWVEPLETGELEVSLEGSGDIRLHEVTADEVELNLAGSGNIQLARLTTGKLRVKLAGSGDIDLGKVETLGFNIDMSGSGDILAEGMGSADNIDVDLAGSGDVNIQTIRAPRVGVNIAGSGDVYVWAEEYLEANIIGSGDVHYHGDPDIDSGIMGSGDVSPID